MPEESRKASGALVAFVLIYVGWQLAHWGPADREAVGDLLLLPVDGAAVFAAFVASRRCSDLGALRLFWRLMAAALAAEALGDVVQALYTVGFGESVYPSLADLFYLTFYPLLLAALLSVPVARATTLGRVRMLLDSATIVVGGGAVVWYFVLGPTAFTSNESSLAMAISMAFPFGDLLLLAGLAAVLLRPMPVALRLPLHLIAAAVMLGILADVLYGYGQLHGSYHPGDFVDTMYVFEFATFALAALCQRPLSAGDPEALALRGRVAARASWLPYLAVGAGLVLLLAVERSDPFFPDLSLMLIVAVLTALVATRQYFAQRELIGIEATLREAERHKDEFLSVVGHELRTPLTSIRGSLGLVQSGVMGPLLPEAAEMVDVAVDNTERLVRLIGDLLDVERMRSGRVAIAMEPRSPTELVNQALQVVQAMADSAGVTLRSRIRECAVHADADRVVQVLVNLLANAIKFSDPGGLVTITVNKRDGEVCFSVMDEGRGIPAEQLETIFERFHQIDASDAREKGGTGLGLPIARGIVESHGGRIWAESGTARGGSTLHFTLPLADQPHPTTQAEPSPSERRPGEEDHAIPRAHVRWAGVR